MILRTLTGTFLLASIGDTFVMAGAILTLTVGCVLVFAAGVGNLIEQQNARKLGRPGRVH